MRIGLDLTSGFLLLSRAGSHLNGIWIQSFITIGQDRTAYDLHNPIPKSQFV